MWRGASCTTTWTRSSPSDTGFTHLGVSIFDATSAQVFDPPTAPFVAMPRMIPVPPAARSAHAGVGDTFSEDPHEDY
jgi:hypothetical protein